MNLLLISPDKSDLGDVNSYFDVWSHYLAREFTRMGISLRYEPLYEKGEITDFNSYFAKLPLEGVDHILAVGLRYFNELPPAAVQILRSRFSGCIAQYNDAPLDYTAVDVTFCARLRDTMQPGNSYVGWAADRELIAPRQKPGELRILIDHPDYTPGREHLDRSVEVIRQVGAFVNSGLWKRKFDTVRVRRSIDGGIEDCDLRAGAVASFSRKHIPYADVCAEYSKTHLFIPTHKESLGLTVLETAMAGALPIVMEDYVPIDRLRTVRHVEFRDEIPWDRVLADLDIGASRLQAATNSWSRIAMRIVTYFGRFGQWTHLSG